MKIQAQEVESVDNCRISKYRVVIIVVPWLIHVFFTRSLQPFNWQMCRGLINTLGHGLTITYSVTCQVSDYVFLRRVLRRTNIAKTLNLLTKIGLQV